MSMRWIASLLAFGSRTQRPHHKNPAVAQLYRQHKSLDQKASEIVTGLPDFTKAIISGGDYIYQRIVAAQIKEYDLHYGSAVIHQIEIDPTKEDAMIRKIIGFMLFLFYRELALLYPDASLPLSLSSALHFEIYQSMPAYDSFLDYLNYHNPNFEDPAFAPAFKFGNDIAQITGVRDISFSFAISQQISLIGDISRKIIRWMLFHEPIAPTVTPS